MSLFVRFSTPVCSPTSAVRLLQLLNIGTALADFVLLIKCSLLCIFWLLTLRVHNDFSKNFAITISLPITVEVILNIILSLIEILVRYPNMDLLEIVMMVHGQTEVVTRRIFIYCLLLFLWLLIFSLFNYTLSKLSYTIIFLFMAFIATIFDVIVYVLTLFNFNIDSITFYIYIITCVWLLLSFTCIIFLLILKKPTTHDMLSRKKILGWTIPFCLFLPLALLDFFHEYWDYIIIIEKLSPIFIVLAVLTLLPCYRSVLDFMFCSPTFQTSNKIRPEAISDQTLRSSAKLTRPIIIYPSDMRSDEMEMNRNVIYSYLQESHCQPSNPLVYQVKVSN